MKFHFGKTALFLVVPLAVYIWTSIEVLAQYTLHIVLILFVASLAASFLKDPRLALPKTVLHTTIMTGLVGGTGWFLSPFFFLLYLLPIYLGFLYNPQVAFGFLAALILIFITSGSVGEVDPSLDTLILLSLLLVIPLLMYLRKKYLILKQSDKDILILAEESGIKDADTISALLSNRVTKLGVTIRQPLSFIKQAATVLLDEDLNPKEATTYITRIRTTATEALDHVRQFEGDTSVNEVLTNGPKEKTIKKPS